MDESERLLPPLVTPPVAALAAHVVQHHVRLWEERERERRDVSFSLTIYLSIPLSTLTFSLFDWDWKKTASFSWHLGHSTSMLLFLVWGSVGSDATSLFTCAIVLKEEEEGGWHERGVRGMG